MKKKPEFLDIFSEEKTRIKTISKKPKQKIIIDYREKNCFVASVLIRLGFEIEFRELKVADYIVNNTAIERKTVSDFLSSMINKRLFNQLEEIQQYENKLLIIEGLDEQELYSECSRINANAVRGFLLSIALKHKIPIIYSKSEEDTAKFISVLANKKQKENSLNVTKKNLTIKERMQFILESFQGIGPKNAKKLLEKFGNLKNIFNSTKEEIEKIIGKKAETFEILEKNY